MTSSVNRYSGVGRPPSKRSCQATLDRVLNQREVRVHQVATPALSKLPLPVPPPVPPPVRVINEEQYEASVLNLQMYCRIEYQFNCLDKAEKGILKLKDSDDSEEEHFLGGCKPDVLRLIRRQ